MTEVCSNIEVEPHLPPLSGEPLSFRATNSDPGAQIDAANVFWGGGGGF